MPDMHQGYGFPIGGVAASRYPEGVISPGAIGYDINCGVRLLASSIDIDEAEPLLNDLASALDHFCPSGVGTKGHIRLSEKELDEVCRDGITLGAKERLCQRDRPAPYRGGRPAGGADQGRSASAKERGIPQIGTLGAGNHFIEVDLVDEVFDPQAAQAMGLRRGSLVVLIHCGSRSSATRSAATMSSSSRGQ